MRYIFSFIGRVLIVLVLSGCKDSEMTIDKITFSQMQLMSCTPEVSFLYKTQNTQSLLLMFKGLTIDPQKEKQGGSIPQQFDLFYRSFDTPPSHHYFCSVPPVTTPVVLQEIKALAGEVEIITQKVAQGYQYHIYIKNLVLKDANGQQLIDENFVLGTYQKIQ